MRAINPSSYTVFLALILLVVTVGAIVVYRLRRDVEEDCPVTEADVLRDIERAYYEGEMDEAEFRRVTAALKAKQSLAPRPLAAVEPAPPIDEGDPDEESTEPDVEDDPARAE